MHRADGRTLVIDKNRIQQIANTEDRAITNALWTMLQTAMRPSADTSAVSKASLPVWGKLLLNNVSMQFDYSVSIGTGDGKRVATPGGVTDLGVFSADEGGFPHAIDSTHGHDEYRVYTSRSISVRARLMHSNGVADYNEEKLLMDMERAFVKLTGHRPHSQLLAGIPYELELVYADRDVKTGLYNRFQTEDLCKPQLHHDLVDGHSEPHVFVPADRNHYRMSVTDGRLGTAKLFSFKLNQAITSSSMKQRGRKFCLRWRCLHPIFSRHPRMHAISHPFSIAAKKRSKKEVQRMAASGNGSGNARGNLKPKHQGTSSNAGNASSGSSSSSSNTTTTT